MLKIFRNIRKKLLSQNRFTQYLAYAIGEILLVVIGILIALQINTWNQNRANTTKEHEYLVGIKNDLETQIEQFKNSSRIYEMIIDKGEAILVDFGKKGNLLDIDSINTKLSFMMYSIPFPSVTTTFNELNSTGQFNLIKEKSLRSDIIKYYQNAEASKEAVKSNNHEVFYRHIFPFIKSSLIIQQENFFMKSEKVNYELIEAQLSSTFKNNLAIPSKEYEIVNAVTLRIIEAKTNKFTIQTDTNSAELLLHEINLQLNTN
ncbi:DUF6090 family protein [Arenibacter sp. GZD96]|uniref:DUF6090 family protein n=1 Tax=Aurantibrevibacter litoralis TaxID=3106030 RepID=UPI002AFE409F|nr:DUF6090 family protein [Arenibacter sp. GZD-96]MEA1786067.1 DUF6090 family protein [Arenibacter sp. GZD-96]